MIIDTVPAVTYKTQHIHIIHQPNSTSTPSYSHKPSSNVNVSRSLHVCVSVYHGDVDKEHLLDAEVGLILVDVPRHLDTHRETHHAIRWRHQNQARVKDR